MRFDTAHGQDWNRQYQAARSRPRVGTGANRRNGARIAEFACFGPDGSDARTRRTISRLGFLQL